MSFNPIIVAPLDLYKDQVLSISGGATPILTCDPVPVGLLSKLHVFVANTGASSNCTVTIKGKPTATSTLESVLAVFTLTATGTAGAKAGRYIEKFPSYVFCTIANADGTNQATITVTMDRFR